MHSFLRHPIARQWIQISICTRLCECVFGRQTCIPIIAKRNTAGTETRRSCAVCEFNVTLKNMEKITNVSTVSSTEHICAANSYIICFCHRVFCAAIVIVLPFFFLNSCLHFFGLSIRFHSFRILCIGRYRMVDATIHFNLLNYFFVSLCDRLENHSRFMLVHTLSEWVNSKEKIGFHNSQLSLTIRVNG